MDCAYYAANFLFFSVVFLYTPDIGGWSEAKVTVFIMAVFFWDALDMTVFSENMWQFPDLVNQGGLDYYLVRPISTFFFVSFKNF